MSGRSWRNWMCNKELLVPQLLVCSPFAFLVQPPQMLSKIVLFCAGRTSLAEWIPGWFLSIKIRIFYHPHHPWNDNATPLLSHRLFNNKTEEWENFETEECRTLLVQNFCNFRTFFFWTHKSFLVPFQIRFLFDRTRSTSPISRQSSSSTKKRLS